VLSQTKRITRGKKKNIEEESIGNVTASITKKRQEDKKMGSDSEKLITFYFLITNRAHHRTTF
jgi:hypothetical protein